MSLEEQQFAMIENLTEELGEKETKIMELENLIEKYQKEHKIQADREWVKTTFIEYLQEGGEADFVPEIWDFFKNKVNHHYPGSNYYKIFVMMLEQIIGLSEHDLKTEEEVRDDFQYLVDDYYENRWKDKYTRDKGHIHKWTRDNLDKWKDKLTELNIHTVIDY